MFFDFASSFTFCIFAKTNKTVDIMKLGDYVMISPDITMLKTWVKGKVIDVEDNSFVGIVISAETEDGNVFFGRADMFKPVA